MRQSYDRLAAWAIGSAAAILISIPGAASSQILPQEAEMRICIIIPHFKDEYWLSVGYGMRGEAEARNVELLIYESGGYHSLERQIDLLNTCKSLEVDVILIGAVSANDPRLVQAVDTIAQNIPVLALVNALNAANLSGWIGVDWSGMGIAVGQFLTQRHPEGSSPVRAVLISGPDESGWGPLVEGGLRSGLAGSAVEIVSIYRADTGLREQLREVERALKEYPDIDYLIGSAPAIEGAMALLRRSNSPSPPKLIATYISHSVHRGLRSGQIEAVPFDDPIEQGRMGVQMAISVARGQTFPGISGPEITLVVGGSETVQDIRLSPAGFLPDPE